MKEINTRQCNNPECEDFQKLQLVTYCTGCGSKLVPFDVNKCVCGMEYDSSQKFCGDCGRPLK